MKQRYAKPLLLILLILLLFASVVLVYLISGHIKAKKGAVEPLRLSAIAGFDCEYTEAQRLYPFANGLIKLTSTRVAYLSISGNEIYGYDMSLENPTCIVNDKYCMVCDTEGFLYSLFDEDGLVYSEHMDTKISYCSLAPSGLAAFIIDSYTGKGSVYIVETDGTFLAQWDSVESGYPISLCFSPDESHLSVSLVDTDGSEMVPHVKQFQIPDDREIDRPTEAAFYSPALNAIMPSMAYYSNESVALCGISQVALIDEASCQILETTFPVITSVCSYDGGICIFYSDGISLPVKVAIIDDQARLLGEVSLGNNLIAYDVKDNRMIVAYDDQVIQIDLSNQKVNDRMTVDEQVIRLSFYGSKNICLVTSSGVREIAM